MNASGRLNTCKSNVATHGARVRNTYATYSLQEDNQSKGWIILHNIKNKHLFLIKDLSVVNGHASD
jgi:hypothetical protein